MSADFETQRNQKICEEFLYLQDKCNQAFGGLRELPPFGKVFHFFQKTFETYTRLWKYQQNHREVLETVHGLKRWEIGDIASHIGQVYYHYYMRTSDRSYLTESCIFYDAIQQRKYFQELISSTQLDDWRRLLRYHARFLVVCLLLHSYSRLRVVAGDLHNLVQHYVSRLAPPDAHEWLSVVRELRVFCQACLPCSQAAPCLVIPGSVAPPASLLLGQEGAPTGVVLQQCVFIAAQAHQIKFSELTLDFMRMMRALEKDDTVPTSSSAISGLGPGGAKRELLTTSASFNGPLSDGSSGGGIPLGSLQTSVASGKNPLKHLLYRPSLQTALTHLHGAQKEVSGNGALLVYICADAYVPTAPAESPWAGGALMCGAAVRQSPGALNALCLGDLYPLMRKPMMLICEGDSAKYFMNFQSPFGSPAVALLAPQKYLDGSERLRLVVSPMFNVEHSVGSTRGATEVYGNLFTLFLTDPLTAIVRLCKIATEDWTAQRVEKCVRALTECLRASLDQLASSPDVPAAWKSFAQDEFASLFIAKFALARRAIARFKQTAHAPMEYIPRSSPELPDVVHPSDALLNRLFERAHVTQFFV